MANDDHSDGGDQSLSPSEQRQCLIIGLSILGLVLLLAVAGPPLFYSIEARLADHVEVPAELDWCTAMTDVGHGGHDYWVEARDNYMFDGRRYHSERLGYFEQRWRSRDIEVARARRDLIRAREPFCVYVDRRSPSRSVIFDDTSGMLTPKLMAVLLMPIGCFAGVAWTLRIEVLSRRDARPTDMEPSKPWSPGRVGSEYRKGLHGFEDRGKGL